MQLELDALRGSLREELERVPEAMRQDEVSRQVIIAALTQALKEMGLVAVPAWRPPKSTRDRIDLVGVRPGTHPPEVEAAFGVEAVVELAKVKAMEWVEAPHKFVVTFSPRADKVAQSTFFLTPGVNHLDLYG
jgi:hypothetical protein